MEQNRTSPVFVHIKELEGKAVDQVSGHKTDLVHNTKTGLGVECEIDKDDYRTGIKIRDNQMRKINISRSPFHGKWNYTIAAE